MRTTKNLFFQSDSFSGENKNVISSFICVSLKKISMLTADIEIGKSR